MYSRHSHCRLYYKVLRSTVLDAFVETIKTERALFAVVFTILFGSSKVSSHLCDPSIYQFIVGSIVCILCFASSTTLSSGLRDPFPFPQMIFTST